MQAQTDAASPPRSGPMETQVISGNRILAGGTQVALGLLWQPASADLALRDQARLAGGGQGGFDLYVRPDGLKQVGFGSTRDGLSPGDTLPQPQPSIQADGATTGWRQFLCPAPTTSGGLSPCATP